MKLLSIFKKKRLCPDCKTPMQKVEGGYGFLRVKYYVCSKCGYKSFGV